MENFSSCLIEKKVFRSLQTIGRHIICLAFVCSVGLHPFDFSELKAWAISHLSDHIVTFSQCITLRHCKITIYFHSRLRWYWILLSWLIVKIDFSHGALQSQRFQEQNTKKAIQQLTPTAFIFSSSETVILSNLSLWPSLCFFVLSFLITVHPVWLHFILRWNTDWNISSCNLLGTLFQSALCNSYVEQLK